jgi:hypothetical protein
MSIWTLPGLCKYTCVLAIYLSFPQFRTLLEHWNEMIDHSFSVAQTEHGTVFHMEFEGVFCGE